MSRRNTEQPIRVMRWTGLDSGESLPRIVSGLEVQEFVQPFLREDQRPLASGNLERQLHFAARRGPVRLDRTSAAAGKSHDQPCYIIDDDFTLLLRPGCHWP